LENITLEIIVFLTLVATFAGFIDAIAGGGGLLTLPALLWVGIPPLNALATNKLQGCFGTATASLHFWHKGLLPIAQLKAAIVMTFLGAICGTLLVQHVNSSLLSAIIPWLLIGFALFFAFSPKANDLDRQARLSISAFGISACSLIGFYDGFFGPGTGSFFMLAVILLLGFNIIKATATTKLLNFTSNIASLVFFAIGGHVLWLTGLAMGIGQMIGAWLGSQLAIKYGGKVIRPLLVISSVSLSIKLILDNS
jgi:uncharacterized membrane protein YfcA